MWNLYDEKQTEHRIPYLGNEAILTREGPYGHYRIHLKKGIVPSAFEGTFTTVEAAERVIRTHEAKKLAERDKSNGAASL